MASRAVEPNHVPARAELKQKIGALEGRNRRVLQDIGNLVPEKAGKQTNDLSKPTARNFGSQLLANELAEKNKKLSGDDVDFITGGVAKVAVAEKKAENEILVLSSDDDSEEEIWKKHASARKSKKNRKAFSSVLSARSKVACGITKKPQDRTVDIDAADIHNELAVVEYIDDIYKFYKQTEDEDRVADYMGSQPDINAKMRSILLDWLVEVHRKFELMPETLYLTINLVDRYLSMKTVPRKELQLVGTSAMLIACKYEEIWAPEVNDFVCISDKAYAREQVLAMEKAILGKLEWYLTVPTPYVFLVRYTKAAVPSEQKVENMVFFLAELSLMHYPTAIMYCPSMIAASAVYAARCTLNIRPFWTETLKHHTNYSEDQLMECAKFMVSLHSAAPQSKLRAVYRKFSSPDRGAVALISPAKSLVPLSSLLRFDQKPKFHMD